MTADDLKIGNYLLDREKRLCKVEQINVDEFKAPAIVGGLTGLPHQPIEIKKEWLLKFGFEKDHIDNEWNSTDWSGLFLRKELVWYLMRRTNKGKKIEICYGFKYIHELQNLYYALEGKKLILK